MSLLLSACSVVRRGWVFDPQIIFTFLRFFPHSDFLQFDIKKLQLLRDYEKSANKKYEKRFLRDHNIRLQSLLNITEG